MATLPTSESLWTVREYLRTSWSPDREYVDGRIEERNLGEKEHSIIQRYLTVLFALKRAEWGVEVFPELRTQTKPTNFRVPDVLVMRAGKTSLWEPWLDDPAVYRITRNLYKRVDGTAVLFEEINHNTENVAPTDHPKIMRFVGEPLPFETLRLGLLNVHAKAASMDANQVKLEIQKLVSEYKPYLTTV